MVCMPLSGGTNAVMAKMDVQLPHAISSPGLARREIAEYLADRGLGDLLPAAELVVSELVSNAVLHTAGPIHLRLSGERALRIEVIDSECGQQLVARTVDH